MKTQTKPQAKHTPGPWSYEGKVMWVQDTKNRLIAIAEWKDNQKEYPYTVGEKEAKANASLIAAAPDLLEAAKEALSHLGCNGEDNSEAWKMLRAAIAKAEGK